MKLKIRLTDSQDWSILNQLYADMDQKAPLADHRVQEIFTEISQIPNYHIYLAELDYEPVGTFSLLYVPTMMHPGYHRFAILDAVTVISSLRGQGIGTEMVRFALEQS
ncbi:GNAT family N-acetyltransferase, partial [Cylindrospermopsis raciborskii UAM/DH-BiRr]